MLNRSSAERRKILSSVLVIELALTLVALPFVVYLLAYVYPESFQAFTSIAIWILILMSVGFVSRYVVLGISQVKKVLIIDAFGTILKLVTGFILVGIGYGTSGILLSFLIQASFIGVATLYLAIRIFGLKLPNFGYLKDILKDGLVNFPSKLSGVLTFSLSVVLLASFEVANSDIGIFYIALMISFVGSSFAASMAMMLIPRSTISKTDMSLGSTRIGISLTAPLIAVLISSPKFILAIIGTQYLAAETSLVVLAIGILPYCIMINAVSKFNYLRNSRKLILIGSIQLIIFFIGFFILVPIYGTLGASYSILMAFIASSIPSILWSERLLVKYIINVCVAIFAGYVTGTVVNSLLGYNIYGGILAIISTLSVTFLVILGLRNTSQFELKELISTITHEKSTKME